MHNIRYNDCIKEILALESLCMDIFRQASVRNRNLSSCNSNQNSQ